MTEQVQVATEVSPTLQTVTSDNRAEFMAHRLGLAAPLSAEAASTEPAGKTGESDSTASGEANADGTKKPNPKIEKRFSDLTARAKAAEAEATATKARMAELEAQLQQRKPEPKPEPQSTAAKADPKPDPTKYTDPFQYAEDLAQYAAKEALAARDREDAKVKAEAKQSEVITTWTERLDAAKASIPDFEEMIASSDVSISDQVRDAIIDSEVGPQILYELASDGDLAKLLGAMPLAKALREIGKLEAKLSKPAPAAASEANAQSQGEAKPVVPVKSKAPPPINPLTNPNAGTEARILPNGEFQGSFAEYRALRQAGKIR